MTQTTCMASLATPVLFLGHGSPMNAISNNAFTSKLAELAAQFIKPKAICCISAHWQTRGVYILENARPKTLHDFLGFPAELYQVEYNAPGSPEWAQETSMLLAEHDPSLTEQWGLDHGTWSILRHMFPKADVPVFQMSLDLSRSIKDHLELARELKALRKKGVWIVGSGNIVHNLGRLDWGNTRRGHEWAHVFDDYVRQALEEDAPDRLVNFRQCGIEAKWSVPTLDHYLPLIYLLGLREPSDTLSFPYHGFEFGSISMRAVLLQ